LRFKIGKIGLLQNKKSRRNFEVINAKNRNKMYRKSRFLVGLAAAAITFGSLWFTVGPSHFNRGHRSCHPMMEHRYMHHCGDSIVTEDVKLEKGEKVIIIKKVIQTDTVK
jgi:hypothetical protein